MTVVVPEQHVRAIAKADVQIEVAVAVVVHPCRLADGPGLDGDARGRGDVGEAAAIVAIEAQHGSGAGRESDEQIGIAVGVEVTPRGRARGPRVGHAGDAATSTNVPRSLRYKRFAAPLKPTNNPDRRHRRRRPPR